jgi:DNA-binding MarR family transcriptional regulator
MGEALQRRLKQTKFQSVAQETLLNLLVAANHIHELLDNVCHEFGITRQQFNVLRILRGGEPNGYPRGEVTERMVVRAPDVTRLIDRLERQGLVARDRSSEDRRLSITHITDKGLSLLDRIQPRIAEVEKEIMGRLSKQECEAVSAACEKLYNPG